MENSLIEQRLERIEKAVLGQKIMLSFDDFCTYVGISKSHGYKLTSKRVVPFYNPNGKMIYFKREEVDNWLSQNPVKTVKALKEKLKSGRRGEN